MNKIFIVGSGRSGTTVLQSIFSSDESVFSLKETHFMRKSKRPAYARFFDRFFIPKARIRTALSFVTQHNSLIGSYDVGKTVANKDLVHFLDNLLTNEATLRNKKTWVEKTPEHINYVDLFLKHIPNVKVIHAIRDGRDVVASLVDACKKYPVAWKGFETIEKSVDYYNRNVIKSLSFINDPNNFFLNYDNLIENPYEALGRINSFLGFELNVDIKNINSTSSDLVRPEEGWKKENSSTGIHNVKFVKFRKMFTPGEQEYITSNIISINEITELVRSTNNAF